VDATDETKSGPIMGRLVNHSRRGSAKMKVVTIDSIPHLCLFTLCEMLPGEQVLYDYGIKNLPFKDKVSIIR